MISQIYIKSVGTYILCMERVGCKMKEPEGVVVLLPGFSQSCCDIDYFMTNLANELIQMDYVTIQVDLCGHGDSYGELSELSINVIEENIICVYEYVKRTWMNKPIFAVARGFYGNLLYTKSLSEKFEKIICINPVKCKLNLTEYIKYKQNEVLEISEMLLENSLVESFFISSGADITNVRGQKIAGCFLMDIVNTINSLKQPQNAVIISSYNDQNKINLILHSEDKIFPVEYIAEHSFIRDPEWQSELINMVSAILEG